MSKKTKNKRKISVEFKTLKAAKLSHDNNESSKGGKKAKTSSKQRKTENVKNEIPITNFNDIWDCISMFNG